MSAVEQVQAASKALEDAKKALAEHSKVAVKETLQATFEAHPEITAIAWAQRSSEYNDEGMYPGVHGPVLNDGETIEIPMRNGQLAEDELYDLGWLYGWADPTDDARLQDLKSLLETVGVDQLTELFRDENIVVATKGEDGQILIEVEYAGV